nr:MAG TPA: hypothetical protein [Caudoviricetes sp.]
MDSPLHHRKYILSSLNIPRQSCEQYVFSAVRPTLLYSIDEKCLLVNRKRHGDSRVQAGGVPYT